MAKFNWNLIVTRVGESWGGSKSTWSFPFEGKVASVEFYFEIQVEKNCSGVYGWQKWASNKFITLDDGDGGGDDDENEDDEVIERWKDE